MVLLGGAGVARAESIFSNYIYDLPTDSFFLLSEDLNQDGRPDLITSGLNVALGLPGGQIGPPTTWDSRGARSDAALGDFNHDGILDIAQPASGSVGYGAEVHFGKGGGLYHDPQFLSIFGLFQPESIAAGDVNGDGADDLAVGSAQNGQIWVILSRGDGSFDPPLQVASGIFGGVSGQNLAIADLNGDGKKDLIALDTLAIPPATPSQPGFVRVFLGLGDGTFGSPISTGVGISPTALAVADFNHDQRLDLSVANRYSGNASVLLGQGDGAFAAQSPVAIQSAFGPRSVLGKDLDGDGHVDLVVAGEDVFFCKGKGDGSFEAGIMSRSWGEARDLAAGDFDGDARPDRAVLSSPFTVSLLLSNGDGTFGEHNLVPMGGGASTLTLTAADFNRDGIPDLVGTADIFNDP